MNNYQDFKEGIYEGDLQKLKKYINEANINLPVYFDESSYNYPVYSSFLTEDLDIIRYFINLGAYLNIEERNIYFSNSTIEYMSHQAIDTYYQGNNIGTDLEIIKLLYEYGAELNIKSEKNETPLDIAMRSSCTELQDFLRDLGAKTSKELEQEERNSNLHPDN